MAAFGRLAKKITGALMPPSPPPPISLAPKKEVAARMPQPAQPVRIGVNVKSRRAVGESISKAVKSFRKTLERAPKTENEDLIEEIWDDEYGHSDLISDAKDFVTTKYEKEQLKRIEALSPRCTIFHEYVDNLGPLAEDNYEDLYPISKTPLGGLLWNSLSFLYELSVTGWMAEKFNPKTPNGAVIKERVFCTSTVVNLHFLIANRLPIIDKFVVRGETKQTTDFHFSAWLDEGIANLYCRLIEFFDAIIGLYIDLSTSKDHWTRELRMLRFAAALNDELELMGRTITMYCDLINGALQASQDVYIDEMMEIDGGKVYTNIDEASVRIGVEFKVYCLNQLKVYHPSTSPHHIRLMIVLMREHADHKDPDGELKYVQEIYHDRVARLGPLNVLTIYTIHVLSRCQLAAGFVDTSISTVRTYANRQTRLTGTSIKACKGLLHHATALYSKNIYDKSETLLREAIVRLEASNEGMHALAHEIARSLCEVYISARKWTQGREFASNWIDKCTSSLGRKHKTTLGFITQLGLLYHLEHNLLDCITSHQEAVTGLLTVAGDKDPITHKAITNLACALFTTHDWEAALHWYKRLLFIHERDHGASDRTTLRALIIVGSTQAAAGLLVAARETFLLGLDCTLAAQPDLKTLITSCLAEITPRIDNPPTIRTPEFAYRVPATFTLTGQLVRDYSAKGLHQDALALCKQAFLAAHRRDPEGEDCQSYRGTLAGVLRGMVRERLEECVLLHREGLQESIRINDVCEETIRWRWWLGWVLCHGGERELEEGVMEVLKALREANYILGREHSLVGEIMEFLKEEEEEGEEEGEDDGDNDWEDDVD